MLTSFAIPIVTVSLYLTPSLTSADITLPDAVDVPAVSVTAGAAGAGEDDVDVDVEADELDFEQLINRLDMTNVTIRTIESAFFINSSTMRIGLTNTLNLKLEEPVRKEIY